jgi:hypothetical protein
MIRMIGRGFWLTLGAVLGVGGYRKAARLARAVSPVRPTAPARSWTASPAETAQRTTTVRASWAAWTAGLVRGARASAGFARDVREGMRIYRLSYRREAPTLGRHRATQDWAFAEGEFPDEVKDGR